MAQPYLNASDHLRDMLHLVSLLLKRHIARHGHRLLQADGRLSDLHVSLDEVRTTLTGDVGSRDDLRLQNVEGWPGLEESEALIASWKSHIEARVLLTELEVLPLEHLRAVFRLSDLEIVLLLAAAAPALLVDLERLYTFARADFTKKAPSVGFLCELVADEDPWSLRACFEGGASLVDFDLLFVGQGRGEAPALLERPVRVPEDVLNLLLGAQRGLPESVRGFCRLQKGTEAVSREDLFVDEVVLRRMEQHLQRTFRWAGRRARIFLTGVAGSGRLTLSRTLMAELGVDVLEVDLNAMLSLEDLPMRMRALGREAMWRGAALVLRGDALGDEVREHALFWSSLELLCARVRVHILLVSHQRFSSFDSAAQGFEVMDVPSIPRASQRALWQRELSLAGHKDAETLATRASHRLDLPPGVIVRTVKDALSQVRASHRKPHHMVLEDLTGAFGEAVSHRLFEVAELVETPLTWEDAVLPEDTLETLKEIQIHGAHGERVFEEWGFRSRYAYGRGMACLFSGPPGTGKTMMAGILARALDRPLYRIDLSRITSKWVGETEKNLARLFDEATRAQSILLFDEADSLFASRTSVKSSNDRFANMEVNYLLQRMENYEGITILTTNFESSIDDAFKRRIRFRAHFPFPDEGARQKLWRSMIPSTAPVSDDIGFEKLARDFEMAGGHIKNAVLRAAFFASSSDGMISEKHLRRAAVAEARQIGLLVAG